jgi:hypothetical protein
MYQTFRLEQYGRDGEVQRQLRGAGRAQAAFQENKPSPRIALIARISTDRKVQYVLFNFLESVFIRGEILVRAQAAIF